MKTFKEISAQIERIERLYYNFGCGTRKMLETAERFFFSQQRIGLSFQFIQQEWIVQPKTNFALINFGAEFLFIVSLKFS